jgi:propanol-preferring alcohol dehydrogenase
MSNFIVDRIIGAKVPGPLGAMRCLEFSLRKGIYPKINPRKFQLEDINEMMDLMKAGKVHEGRMTVQFF